MREVPLRNSPFVALVDDRDFPIAMTKNWFMTEDGYVRSTTLPRTYLHNFPIGVKGLDHKDGIKLNCQRRNLRLATVSQNGGNRKRSANNRTGFKGVNFNYHKYRAQVNVGGKRIYLGRFLTALEAARAYDAAAKKHHGEYARLNFPES
jgi:hypothetical protein